MMKLKRSLITAAFALAALMPVQSIAQTTLNYSHYGPDRGDSAALLKQFAEDVSKATNGEVQIRITFGGALLSTRETARGVASRVADLGTFISAFNPAEFANYSVVDLPINPSDPWVGVQAAMELVETDPVVAAEFDAMNLKLLANFTAGPIIFMCRDKVDSLAAFDGAKFRIQPPHAQQFAEFGVISVSVSTPEVYQSIERRYIDCAQGYITAMIPYRQYEVAKYVLEVDQGQALGFGAVINKDVFDSLTEDQQKALVEAGRKLTNGYAEITVNNVKRDREALEKEHGVTFLKLSPEDQARLNAAAEVTLDKFREKADASVLDHFVELTGKYEAEQKQNGYPWE